MRINRKVKDSQNGFTIIELMIATSVLSVLILMSTIIIINIGSLYYKGVNQANAQDNVRAITDDVAQHLRLGSNVVDSGAPVNQGGGGQFVSALCVDNTRYTYVIGFTGLAHILWRDNISPGVCQPAYLNSATPTEVANGGVIDTGSELISTGSRLTWFSVLPTTSPYTITIGIAYGDHTLTNADASASAATVDTVMCNGNVGDKFCATAYLTTTVDKRDF